MKPVREIVSREIIDDLWGAGYTILPRRRGVDPFDMPAEMVPQGRSYQWMHLVHDKFHFEGKNGQGLGWAPVPASRHDGYFMPAGHVGDIEVNGLGLFEKPKFEVDAERAEQTAQAKKMVDDWGKKNSALFDGHVLVGTDRVEIGTTKTFEDATKIPRELTPYIAQIFEERDRLINVDDWNELSPAEAKSMAILQAIETIRKRITEEATSGQASEH